MAEILTTQKMTENIEEQRSPLAKKYCELYTRPFDIKTFKGFHPITKLPLNSSPAPPLSRQNTDRKFIGFLRNEQENLIKK